LEQEQATLPAGMVVCTHWQHAATASFVNGWNTHPRHGHFQSY